MDFIAQKPGDGVAIAHSTIREHIPTLIQDRVMASDIQTMLELIRYQTLIERIEDRIGRLH